MGAVVRELYVFRQRGQPGEAVESAWFRRGIGMEGDRHVHACGLSSVSSAIINL